jgi:hypothetical protein
MRLCYKRRKRRWLRNSERRRQLANLIANPQGLNLVPALSIKAEESKNFI